MRSVRHRHHLPPLLLMLCELASLGATAPARSEDQDSSAIGWGRIGHAARNAALAPRTWATLLGALVLQTGDADRQLQSWAAEHTPLFGSRANADRISDDLKFAANGIWIASAVAPWQGDEDGSWLAHKTPVLLVQAGATMVTSVTVGALKDGTARMRPNGEGATSFPSDHASRVGLHTAMTRSNLAQLGWSDSATTRASVGLDTLSALTAWARVEANQHYPSDVLAGMALGNFIGVLFTDAFLSPADSQRVQAWVQPTRDHFQIMVQWGF